MADPLAPRIEGRHSGFTPSIPTDDLTLVTTLESAEHLGSSICGGLVWGLEKVVNPIFLLSKPLTNCHSAQAGLNRPISFDVKR